MMAVGDRAVPSPQPEATPWRIRQRVSSETLLPFADEVPAQRSETGAPQKLHLVKQKWELHK